MQAFFLVVSEEPRHHEHGVLGEKRLKLLTIDSDGFAVEHRAEREESDGAGIHHASPHTHPIERDA